MAQSSQGTVPAVNRETGGSHQRHGAKVGQKEMSRTALEIDLPDVKTSHNKVRTNIAENLLSFLGCKYHTRCPVQQLKVFSQESISSTNHSQRRRMAPGQHSISQRDHKAVRSRVRGGSFRQEHWYSCVVSSS